MLGLPRTGPSCPSRTGLVLDGPNRPGSPVGAPALPREPADRPAHEAKPKALLRWDFIPRMGIPISAQLTRSWRARDLQLTKPPGSHLTSS